MPLPVGRRRSPVEHRALAATFQSRRRFQLRTTEEPKTALTTAMPTLALCMHRRHDVGMAINVTIRDVPEEVRDELAARAALAGRSLQEHLRAELIELARRPSATTLIARVRARKNSTRSRLSAQKILEQRDRDRR